MSSVDWIRRVTRNQIDRATEGCIASRELAVAASGSGWDVGRVRARRVLLNPIKATPHRASHIGSGTLIAGIETRLGVLPAIARNAEANAVSCIFARGLGDG